MKKMKTEGERSVYEKLEGEEAKISH